MSHGLKHVLIGRPRIDGAKSQADDLFDLGRGEERITFPRHRFHNAAWEFILPAESETHDSHLRGRENFPTRFIAQLALGQIRKLETARDGFAEGSHAECFN